MSRLISLLRQVGQKDAQLASDLAREVEALSQRRQFGLNFERHTPETVELYGRPIRKGDKVRFVARRGEPTTGVDRNLWKVTGIARNNGARIAKLVPAERTDLGAEPIERAVEDLVVVAEFRDPIYPGLVSTGKIVRGGDKPFHTVINAENFHALQALLYTHEGKVDAIYIDPPYNTRRQRLEVQQRLRRHRGRLRALEVAGVHGAAAKLARRLLNPSDSVLIVTIDEKEVLPPRTAAGADLPRSDHADGHVVINPKGAVAGSSSRGSRSTSSSSSSVARASRWEGNMLPCLKQDVVDDPDEGESTASGTNAEPRMALEPIE